MVLHLPSGVQFSLNGSGSTIWDLVREPRAIREIESELLREYPIEPERCRQDLFEFLNGLAEAGLLQVQNP